MKTYKVIGGYTVYEQYEINVQAENSKDDECDHLINQKKG